MMDSIDHETKITRFDMIRPNSDADIAKKVCLSLFDWANYLLEPPDVEEKNKSEVNSDNDQKGPMLTYKITADEIKWKKTPVESASSGIMGEDWCKLDFDLKNKTNATLMHNMAEALTVCHSKYKKLKRMSNQQKDEMDLIQLGMESLMQMHCNETKTTNDKSFKDTLAILKAKHFEDCKKLDEERVEEEISENTQQILGTLPQLGQSDDDEESDDNEELLSYSTKKKRKNIFDDDDEEELYGIDTNNNPTSDRDKSEGETEEVSKEMTASAEDETTIPEPIDSDKSKQQRASEEESKQTPQKQKAKKRGEKNRQNNQILNILLYRFNVLIDKK